MLHFRHRITNTGFQPFEFLWGLHPGFAITPDYRIDLPAAEVQIEESLPSSRLGKPGTHYTWPFATDNEGNPMAFPCFVVRFCYISADGGQIALL